MRLWDCYNLLQVQQVFAGAGRLNAGESAVNVESSALKTVLLAALISDSLG